MFHFAMPAMKNNCKPKKLHDKITIGYTLLLGLCKKHQVKYGFGTISLASLVVNGKFCLLTNKQVITQIIFMLGLMPPAQQLYLVEIMMLTEKLWSKLSPFFECVGSLVSCNSFSLPQKWKVPIFLLFLRLSRKHLANHRYNPSRDFFIHRQAKFSMHH